MTTWSPDTMTLNVLSVLKSLGRKRVPIGYVAQSVNRSPAEVKPVLNDLAEKKIVLIDGDNVTLR